MPQRLSPLALAALAIFAEGPAHAYEVYSTMRHRREDRTVKLSPGSLYRSINAMAADELLTEVETCREGNRPVRTIFAITDQGRWRLEQQIAELIATPVYEYPRFTVGMAEAHNLPAEEVARLLEQRVAVLDEEIAALMGGIDAVRERKLPTRFWFDVDLTLTATRAERDWCVQVISGLTDGTLDWVTPAPSHDGDRLDHLTSSPMHPRVPPTPRDTAVGTTPSTRRTSR